MHTSKYLLLAFLAVNFILVSCSKESQENTSSTSSSSVVSDGSDASYTQKTDTITSSGSAVVKKISVSSRCVGCGKCARIDSVHFKINQQTRKAVPTQASGNDSALEHAIDCCPVSAISVG